ncbi:MAG: hypothetical protein WCV92_01950 [Candidatus Buchananbacteria bacterium]
MENMLGVLRKVVGLLVLLSDEMMPTLYDLMVKLSGEDGWNWLAELKKLLRKQAWKNYLHLVSGGERLIIDAINSKETMQAGGFFSFRKISTYFLYHVSPPTTPREAAVYGIKDGGTFSKMFGSLALCGDVFDLCLTPGQIANFVTKYPDWLAHGGASTFFLTEQDGQLLVVDVAFVEPTSHTPDMGDPMSYRDTTIWPGGHDRRLVVPIPD